MWISAVSRPSAPSAALHQYLWGYFPEVEDGSERPFLYRELESTVLMLSRVKPACPATNIQDRIESGRVYQFDVMASPRNGRNTRNTQHKHRFMRGNDERRQWFERRLDGAEATFVQVYDRPDLRMKHQGSVIARPACIIRGTVRVTDRAEFLRKMLAGIGGGGVWGFGLLVLPEVMTCSR